jgi:HNH endonuclease
MTETIPPTIFFNIAWMNEYRGITDTDMPLDGGSWTDKHEVCNFLPVDGRCYGFVQPPGGVRLNISRIGAPDDADFIDGVTVVWSARARSGKTVVVGIYQNARVYRERQKLPFSSIHNQNGFILTDYFAECREEDAFLISGRRTHFIPRGLGGMGQSLVWYGDTQIGQDEAGSILTWLNQLTSEQSKQAIEVSLLQAKEATLGSFDDDVNEIEKDIRAILDSSATETTKSTLIHARIGQGKFRQNLMQIWRSACAVTGCQIPALLRASHIKPWRECVSAAERLSPDNGLMLSANLDALFDRGLISFDKNGTMLVSPDISESDQNKLGLKNARLSKKPSEWQEGYLSYHRPLFGF